MNGLSFRPWLLLLLAFVTATGVLDRGLEWFGPRQLQHANAEYLDQAFERALVTFAVLSTVKAGLAVVTGSQVGVGFGVELGDAVQSVYDYVDIAWKTVFTGAVVLLGLKYILTTLTSVDHLILAIALLAAAAGLLLARYAPRAVMSRTIFRDSTRVMVVTAIAMYLLAPLSVTGASMLSKRITEPASVSAIERFDQLRTELAKPANKSGILSELYSTPDRIKRVLNYVSTEGQQLGSSVIRLVAGYLFDCIVFPLGLFIVAYALTRAVVRYVLNVGMTQRIPSGSVGIE